MKRTDHYDDDFAEEDVFVILIDEDGAEISCTNLGIFDLDGEYGEKEYVALSDGEEIYWYIYEENEDSFEIFKIEDDEELEAVQERFEELLQEEPSEDEDYITIVDEDGDEITCFNIGVFDLDGDFGDKEYIGLRDEETGSVYVYIYAETEDSFDLVSIEDEEEYDAVYTCLMGLIEE